MNKIQRSAWACRAAVLPLLLCASSAGAQESSDNEGEEAEATVESVPVGPDAEIHSQVASFAVTSLRAVPAVVTAVSREEIRSSGARDLIDVLFLVPGFYFGVDIAGIIGIGFRGMWGYEGKVLLLIDGKDMNEQLYSTVQVGNEFPIELIERVEVIRGPGSVIYGGNAELAVINVITRGLQGSTDFLASGTYGQMTTIHGRRSLTLSGRAVFENVPGFSAYASASIGQGQRADALYTDRSGTLASMSGRSNLDPMVLQLGVGYRDLQASFLFHRYSTRSVDGYDTAVSDDPIVGDFNSVHGELIYTWRPSERFALTPRLNVSAQTPWQEVRPTDYMYDKIVRRIRGRLIAQWAPLDPLQLTAGVDMYRDDAWLNQAPGTGLQAGFGADAAMSVAYQNYAAFLEAYFRNPILDVVAGARYDYHSEVGSSFVPRLVLLNTWGPFSAKGIVSFAFRAPGIENISLGDNIRPERTTVFELEGGLQMGEHHNLSLNLFDMGISDPIIYSYDAATDSEAYRNFLRQGSRGFEVSYRVKGSWGRGQLAYSFYLPAGENDVAPYLIPNVRDSFAALPNHRATLHASFRVLPWLSLNPTAIVVGPRYSVDVADETTGISAVETLPTQALLNFFIRAEDLGVKGLEVGAGVYNILGTDFRFAQPYAGGHAPLPALSREYLVRISYLFDSGAQ